MVMLKLARGYEGVGSSPTGSRNRLIAVINWKSGQPNANLKRRRDLVRVDRIHIKRRLFASRKREPGATGNSNFQ